MVRIPRVPPNQAGVEPASGAARDVETVSSAHSMLHQEPSLTFLILPSWL